MIEVSELNYNKEYIHTVVKFEEAGIGEDYSEVYKISLPQKSPIGTIDTISMKDFIIIERKKGYQHPKSLKKIKPPSFSLMLMQRALSLKHITKSLELFQATTTLKNSL